jgi:hypothetical protein
MKNKNRKKNGLAVVFFVIGLIVYILGLFLLFGTSLERISFIKSIMSHIPFIFDKSTSIIKLYGGILFIVGFVIFMISVILLYKDNKILEDSKNLIIEGKADVITIIIMTYVLIFMLVICLMFDEVIGALLFGIAILIQSVVNTVLINYYNKNYKK